MEFQRWWVLKSKTFGQVFQKLGIILENRVVQKLKLENNVVLTRKWSPKVIFLKEKTNKKIVDF